MKKNLYYRRMYDRTLIWKLIFMELFLNLSATFRIPIELISRKNFGERYFNWFYSLIVIAILAAIPYINTPDSMEADTFLGYFATWYLYVGVLVYCTYKRWLEVRRNPSVFDFARFSLCTGDLHPFFKVFPVNDRVMELYVEPLCFFIPGLLLVFFEQPLGILLMICAILYYLGYWAAYTMSGYAIMDQIDEIICTRDMKSVYLEDEDAKGGTPFYGRKPSDPEHRRALVAAFLQTDEEDATEVI